MATQANEYFVITDGTVTATFSDGLAGNTDYRLVDGWAPAVAHLSDSQLGGRGPYQDVTEQAEIVVKGATWTAAKANVGALERLLQQAERWSRGENVSVVLVKWAPKGSTVATTAAPFQAVVLGGAFAFSQRWTQDQATFQTNGRLTFQRRGAWLLSAAVTGTSAAVANPGPYPITGMTTHPNISPTQVKLANINAANALDVTDSKPILLIAQQDSDLQILSAAGISGPVQFASTADVANLALGNSVIRYTPAITSEVFSIGGPTFGSMTASARRIAFFAAVRNNSGTTTFKIRAAAQIKIFAAPSTFAKVAYTPLVTIDASHTRPRFIPLGVVSLPGALQTVDLGITASAASGSLDINYIVALAVDTPYSRAIQLDAIQGAGNLPPTAISDLFVDPLPLSALSPTVYRNPQSTSDKDPMGYFGDTYPVASGTTFSAALMAKFVAQTSFWRCGIAGPTVTSLTLTASRYNAYLAPE